MALKLLSLRVPRESENTPEQTAQLLASLSKAAQSPNFLQQLFGKQKTFLSLEVTLQAGQVVFNIAFPDHLTSFVQSQVLATYPDVIMTESPDPLKSWPKSVPHLAIIRQTYAPFYPLRDYADYMEVDPMLPLLGILSKASENDRIFIQFVISAASKKVSENARKYLVPKVYTDSAGNTIKDAAPTGKKLIEDKLSYPLVGVSIHFASSSPELIHDLKGAVSVLNRPDGNSLSHGSLLPWDKKRLWSNILERKPYFSFLVPRATLNVMELSSLWHLPGVYTKIPNVAWSVSSSINEAPEDLPVFVKEADNSHINFFATTAFRNQQSIFGIKLEDRMRHMYILGKSGTGKSTLLENMAVDDFKKGRGVAFIDPHGDSVENLLNYIPSNRINDVIYFNPADRDQPISLNILEVQNPEQAELVASGIVAIFHKLYGNVSWGPRLEYILRNTVLTLAQVPGSTLPDVVKMLTQADFRSKIYPKLKDNQLLSFWKNEFDKLEERTRTEQIASILNKVGQFVNSPLIHNIISQPKSSINLADILNSGKILLANLSQGRLGEDNAALLGAMLVTQLELAAMSRVDMPKDQRKEFFLYVDEFQNFATSSFMKILSEARKYRLGLILANQYTAQLPEDIQKAIFGNAGTIISFVAGSDDARLMEKEFGEIFTANTLVSLPTHQVAMKMCIDGTVGRPFAATTLPPLKSTNQNRDKVITSSRSRYGRKPTK